MSNCIQSFNVGELVRRKTISDGKPRALCVVVDKDGDNYTLYNNSLNLIKLIVNE